MLKLRLFTRYLLLAGVVVFGLPSRGEQPVVPLYAATPILYNCLAKPADLHELQLQDLEARAGIQRLVWGIVIPAKTDLVLHFTARNTSKKTPVNEDFTYRITGPLPAAFENRFSLVRQTMPLPNSAPGSMVQFFLAINTKDNGMSSTVGSVVIPLVGWSCGWSLSAPSPNSNPSPLYTESQGPQSEPKQVTFKLDVSICPSAPGAKPGDIRGPK